MASSIRNLWGFVTAAATGVLLSSSFAATVLAGELPACPVPYFTQDASAYPVTIAVDQKGNQDGIVCVLVLATPDSARAGFVIIDNNVH